MHLGARLALCAAAALWAFHAGAQDLDPVSPTGTGADGNAALVKRTQEGPIDISADGETTYNNLPEGRVATATENVYIQTADASIYCDHAEYNLDTHEALLVGNVRIYRLDTSVLADRAIYNFDSKSIRALDYHGAHTPYYFGGVSVFSPGAGTLYNVRQGGFTTDDSSKPDYHLSSRRIRIYPDDRVVYIGSTLYIGTTPVFYFPYFYQSLDQQSGYTVSPGYSSTFGAYLLTGFTFPITDKITGLARLDYRLSRGAAAGLTFEYRPNRKTKTPPAASNITPYASEDNPGQAAVISPSAAVPAPTPKAEEDESSSSDNDDNGNGNNENRERNGGYALTGEALSRQIRDREGATLVTYFLDDQKPDLNRTALDRLPVDPDRYRLELKDISFITDDWYFKTDIDKLSDRYLLQDFYESEFTRNPDPNNDVSMTLRQPSFVATIVARAQLNNFSNTTERLPELDFDTPRMELFHSGVFYENENSAGYLKRTFDDESPLPDYSAFRIDTFHQLSYPQTFFDWLSVVPRVGMRATYYSESAPSNTAAYNLQNVADDTEYRELVALNPATASATDLTARQSFLNTLGAFKPQGDIIRPVLDAGLEASFKLSRVYDNVESRAFGLDELQHVIQPYMDFAFTEDFGVGSNRLLQFDRRLPSTELQPIDFPDDSSIDSIDENTVVRLGVRNRFQTKRDALTFDWLEVDSYFQVAIYDPEQPSRFSNFFNEIDFRPLPWVTLSIDSQLPAFNGKEGFTDVNTTLNLQATSNLDLNLSHRYLDNNPYFANSSLLSVGAYYRVNDNWAAGFTERYEFADHQLQAQSYTLYRDLSSFVASLGFTVRNNSGINDYGLLLNFTLKGIPKVALPVGFDVNSVFNQTAQ
jgi:lipopolysaccharide assembly outer membrane protein LptD (OstA)